MIETLRNWLGNKTKIDQPEFVNFHFSLATSHSEEMRVQALEYWKKRVEKHSKPDGCSGCLHEATNEIELWTKM